MVSKPDVAVLALPLLELFHADLRELFSAGAPAWL